MSPMAIHTCRAAKCAGWFGLGSMVVRTLLRTPCRAREETHYVASQPVAEDLALDGLELGIGHVGNAALAASHERQISVDARGPLRVVMRAVQLSGGLASGA
jgi:hypothetical protein